MQRGPIFLPWHRLPNFIIRRPLSACHAGRVFGLNGRIQTPDRRNVSTDTLRHLAVMYCNRVEEVDHEDSGWGHRFTTFDALCLLLEIAGRRGCRA